MKTIKETLIGTMKNGKTSSTKSPFPKKSAKTFLLIKQEHKELSISFILRF